MTNRKSLSYLIEAELEKATVLLAAKAITDELQQIAEKLARMDANDVMPLGDSMRDLFGSEQASSFESAVSEKLRGLTEQVRKTKNEISDQIDALESGKQVNDLTDQSNDDIFADTDADAGAPDPFASDEHAAPHHPMHPAQGHDDLGMGDTGKAFDMGGAAGRPQKESRQSVKKMLEGASADHRLAQEFAGLLREGKSVSVAANQIAENYAMDVRTVVDIITNVKKG